MKIAQFSKSWHGIDFSTLPIKLEPRSLPSPQFYSAFYDALGRQILDARWLAQKEFTGNWIMRNVLDQFDRPAILSIGSGLATSEQIWMAHSLDLTLHEIQAESLVQARAKYPNVPVLIGDILTMDIPKKFDVITLLAIDYTMNDEDMGVLFRRLYQILKPGGVILIETVNALTIRRIILEPIKRWILRRYENPGWLFWGWSRTPSAIARMARRMGFVLHYEAVRSKSDYTMRSSLLLGFPTVVKPEVIFVFGKPSSPSRIVSAN